MFNDWLTLAFLATCLFAMIRPLRSETIKTAGAGRLRWPVRVKVRIRLPIPRVKRQQGFLSPPPPLEAVPSGRRFHSPTQALSFRPAARAVPKSM